MLLSFLVSPKFVKVSKQKSLFLQANIWSKIVIGKESAKKRSKGKKKTYTRISKYVRKPNRTSKLNMKEFRIGLPYRKKKLEKKFQ